MKTSRLRGAVCACLVFVFAGPSSAMTVSYDVTNISGNTWEYTYTLSNDILAVDIEEITIFFDYTAYENLTLSTAPVDWDPLIFQPGTTDGFYDVLALASGIALGGSLGGFTVQFDYLPSGTPGSQVFNIVDPLTFATLDSGQTVLAAVPIPTAIWLFGSGLLGLIGIARSKKA